MRRAIEVKPKGQWSGKAVSSVTLAFTDRHRRRIRMVDDAGTPFLLDLADVALLEDGDGLALEGGGVIVVLGAAESVADIECRDAIHATKIAWHIGNRHTALQVLDDARLRIADDHVLVAMVEGLGARVLRHDAPFQPEPGAYVRDHGETHGHDHG